MDDFEFLQQFTVILILVAIAMALYLHSILGRQQRQQKETRRRNRTLAFEVERLDRRNKKLDGDTTDLKGQVQDLERGVGELRDENRDLRYNWNRINLRLLDAEERLLAANTGYGVVCSAAIDIP